MRTSKETNAQRGRKRIVGKAMTTKKFRNFMTKILEHGEDCDPLMKGLQVEAQRIDSELTHREWNRQDYGAIARFMGERAVHLRKLTLPLEEHVYIGGHLFPVSEVDEDCPGWREEAEREKVGREAGTEPRWAISLKPSYYKSGF